MVIFEWSRRKSHGSFEEVMELVESRFEDRTAWDRNGRIYIRDKDRKIAVSFLRFHKMFHLLGILSETLPIVELLH